MPLGNQVTGAEDVEVAAQQRMGADVLPQGHRVLDALLHELEALELHLSSRDVERREDLVVRRRRRVGEVRLHERRLREPVELLVVDVDHRPLPQR